MNQDKKASFMTCNECLDNTPLLKDLPAKDKELLRNNMSETNFKSGEIIFKQGVPLSHVIFNTNGYTKIYLDGMEDKEVILTILGPYKYLSGPGLFYGGKFHFTAKALTDVSTCFINKEIFLEIIRNNSDFASVFLIETAKRSINRINSFTSIFHKRIPGKMAGALIYFSDVVYKSRSFNTLLSRQELGNFTGMAKESVIRVLKDFKTEGVINLKGDYVEILNYDLLKKIHKFG